MRVCVCVYVMNGVTHTHTLLCLSLSRTHILSLLSLSLSLSNTHTHTHTHTYTYTHTYTHTHTRTHTPNRTFFQFSQFSLSNERWTVEYVMNGVTHTHTLLCLSLSRTHILSLLSLCFSPSFFPPMSLYFSLSSSLALSPSLPSLLLSHTHSQAHTHTRARAHTHILIYLLSLCVNFRMLERRRESNVLTQLLYGKTIQRNAR